MEITIKPQAETGIAIEVVEIEIVEIVIVDPSLFFSLFVCLFVST